MVDWHTGYREKAEEMVQDQVAYQLELVEKGGIEEKSGVAYFDLFLCYALLGDKQEAYKNLHLFVNNSSYRWAQWLTYLQDDPLADNLRGDEEYQQIARQYEAEFHSERDRIRKWLEENSTGFLLN